MQIKVKNAGQAAFMRLSGAKFIEKTLDNFYIFESDIKRKVWRSAYAKTELFAFNEEVIRLLNLNKGK